jgi:hypothetical protein
MDPRAQPAESGMGTRSIPNLLSYPVSSHCPISSGAIGSGTHRCEEYPILLQARHLERIQQPNHRIKSQEGKEGVEREAWHVLRYVHGRGTCTAVSVFRTLFRDWKLIC